jgi:hypothetical protein
MHLVQLLLPIHDNARRPFAEFLYSRVRRELTKKYGGMTAFTRAPAQGLWTNEGETTIDDIVVFEVMTSSVECEWWGRYRRILEKRFRQEHIVIRDQQVHIL